MTFVFGLDVIACALSMILATALALIVVAAGVRRTPNRLFAGLALGGGLWAAFHSMVALALRFRELGDPLLWQQLSTLSFGVMPSFLLMYTVRYLNRPTRWADLAGAFGLSLIVVSWWLPPLRAHIISWVKLDANGLPTFELGEWGRIAAGLVGLYYGVCLILFWLERHRTQERYLPISIIILLIGLGFRTMLSHFPITSITATISIGLLGYGVVRQQLFNPLRELTLELERKVEERTRELEEVNRAMRERGAELETANLSLRQATQKMQRRAAQIAAGAEIARVATTLLDPESLITRVVQLIQARFDFYYVGLFLVDAERRYAVLQYGVGRGTAADAGRIMKERGHRLEIGGESMIGWACANKQARIALDVGQDAVRFANPLLPDTHSEMALPLRVGEEVIGALTVQSTEVAAFDEDDIAALQGMADQIAVALQNARLFQQTQATLKELELTNRLLVREGWQKYMEQRGAARRAEWRAAHGADTAPLSEPLHIPLELRGQPLGKLTLRRAGQRPWTSEEIELVKAIASQTTLAADNARLVEQTQAALRETEGLFQASAAITQATQVGQLEVLCQELANRFNELLRAHTTRFTLVDRDKQKILVRVSSGQTADTQLRMTYAELNQGIGGIVLRTGQPVLSLDADDGIEPEETRQRRKQANIGALIVAPLNVKGKTIGIISTYNQIGQRCFTQHDVDLVMALTAQAATAIENIQLLEQTQRRAEREQLIRQITTRIRAAGDIEGVLQTTAVELAQAMRVPRAVVRLTAGGEAKPG